MNSTYKVVYIAGNGHSGSTLLDIILGNGKDCFSVGELSFIVRNGLLEEYCSCNSKISDCDFWDQVFEIWSNNRTLSFDEYRKLRHRYERNATFLRTCFNSIFPSRDFKSYKNSTSALFDAIHEVSGAKIIIDSSKSPQRIAVLKGIVDVQVIHLCREFKGVLNSAKSSSQKDIEKGIEEDNHPRSTRTTLIDWIITNFFTEFCSIGINSTKLMYKDYIQHPEKLGKIHESFNDVAKISKYSADHMIAGNIIRL